MTPLRKKMIQDNEDKVLAAMSATEWRMPKQIALNCGYDHPGNVYPIMMRLLKQRKIEKSMARGFRIKI